MFGLFCIYNAKTNECLEVYDTKDEAFVALADDKYPICVGERIINKSSEWTGEIKRLTS